MVNPEPGLYLFQIAIGKYDNLPDLNANGELDHELDAVRTTLEHFGAVCSEWTIPMRDRGGDAVAERLAQWPQQCSHSTVLHWVGHGWSNFVSSALAHSKSPKHVGAAGITPVAIAEQIAIWHARAEAHSVAVVLVDACMSTRFAEQLSSEVDDLHLPRPVRALLVGTSGEGTTNLGRLSRCLETLVHATFKADHTIDLWTFARELKRNLPGSTVIPKDIEDHSWRRTDLSVTALISLEALQRFQEASSSLSPDERGHFLPKAQGSELGEPAWYFEGRLAELAEIVSWVRSDTTGILVVTGDPGAGKSALIGNLVVQSKPALVATLHALGLIEELPEECVPPPNAFDAVIHLTGLTTADAILRLADQLGLSDSIDGDPSEDEIARRSKLSRESLLGELASTLLEQLSRSKITRIVFDALDEADDPVEIARVLLYRLNHKYRRIQVVVGTRLETFADRDPKRKARNILEGIPTSGGTITLGPEPTAMQRYVEKRLRVAKFRTQLAISDNQIKDVATKIGNASDEFLFASLAVHEIIVDPRMVRNSAKIERLAASKHEDLFKAAVARIAKFDQRYIALLQTLALANGRGIPLRDGLWADITRAVSPDTNVDDGTIAGLLEFAAPYIAIGFGGNQTVYRLGHQTYIDYLLPKGDASTSLAHQAATNVLVRHALVSLDEGTPINPYAVHNLPAHATAGGVPAWFNLTRYPEVLGIVDHDAYLREVHRVPYADDGLFEETQDGPNDGDEEQYWGRPRRAGL